LRARGSIFSAEFHARNSTLEREKIMRKTAIRLLLAGAAFVAATGFDVPASYAAGDAPWCAVISLGPGEVYWDCRYRTIEECVPNVLAGNRGFCNLNPAPGPTVTRPPRPHYRWHHAYRHRRRQ
jgi:hypothetical protein